MKARLARALATFVLALPSLAHAQTSALVGADATVRALSAPLVDRHGGAGSAPLVVHASGDLVFAAVGVLRTDPEGNTRWHYPDEEIVDVATTPDGAVVGLARTPADRPRSVRLVRLASDGTQTWMRTYHRGAIDTHTYADVTGAPNGDVVLCSTTSGRRTHVVVDRIDSAGAVRWSREMEVGTECSVVATDASGSVFWAGVTNGGATTILEKLDANGRSVWRTLYEGNPLPGELSVTSDAITLGGDFDGAQDLLPGAPQMIARTSGYRAFVTRFDPNGSARWAWFGRNDELVSVLRRGNETIVVQDGTVVRLDANGQPIDEHRFGFPVYDGMRSEPYLSTTGGLLDANGRLVIAMGLPRPEYMGVGDLYLFADAPYVGPRDMVIGRPGW